MLRIAFGAKLRGVFSSMALLGALVGAAQAADLPIGSEVNGTLPDGEEQAYTLRVTSSGEYVISVNQRAGSSLDPMVTVYQGRTELGTDDDGGENLNSRLSINLESGTYNVVVRGIEGTGGAFTILVECVSASGSGGSITVGGSRTGSLAPGGSDTYSLTVPSTGSVCISAEKAAGSTLDPRITLRDSRGEYVGYDDDGGEGTNARLVVSVNAGTYTVLVEGLGQSAGAYRLSVTPGIAAAQGSIALGVEREGYIENGAQHRYVLENTGTAELVITVRNNGSPLDPRVSVWAADGEIIVTNDDYAEGVDARVVVNLSPGLYYVVVETVGRTSGRYTVTVE